MLSNLVLQHKIHFCYNLIEKEDKKTAAVAISMKNFCCMIETQDCNLFWGNDVFDSPVLLLVRWALPRPARRVRPGRHITMRWAQEHLGTCFESFSVCSWTGSKLTCFPGEPISPPTPGSPVTPWWWKFPFYWWYQNWGCAAGVMAGWPAMCEWVCVCTSIPLGHWGLYVHTLLVNPLQ